MSIRIHVLPIILSNQNAKRILSRHFLNDIRHVAEMLFISLAREEIGWKERSISTEERDESMYND